MSNKIFIKSADDKDLPVYIYEPSVSRIGAGRANTRKFLE